MAAIAITASGLVTGLGFNAPATLAALRAGITAVGQTSWVDRESGERLNGAKVGLPHWWEGIGKLAELVAPAIHECMMGARPERAEEIPWLIGVASPARPARHTDLETELFEELSARFGFRPHPESKILAMDQVGCAVALEMAGRLIDEGKARRVVVAGVDSFLHQPTLDVYIDKRRVRTPGNSNGFAPGEAGTAVLVECGRSVRRRRASRAGIRIRARAGGNRIDRCICG